MTSSLVPAILNEYGLEETIRLAIEAGNEVIESVVVQDEYTHDVVLRYADGVYLVYDTT